MIVPLILIAAQFVFYGKRSEEFTILRAVGKSPRQRRRLFFAEAGLFAVLAGLCTAAVCPVGYLFVLFLADAVKLPQTIAGFDPSLYAALVAIVMASCLLSGLLSYLRVEREPTANKHRSPRGNRQIPPSHFEKEVEL